MTTLTANLEERIDIAKLQHLREEVGGDGAGTTPESTAPLPRAKFSRFLEDVVAKRFGQLHLAKLAAHRGQVTSAWKELPERMHRVANQTQLMLELVDDFRAGTYRNVPWHSLAICAAAILYAANPADVLPDMLLGFGLFDDLAVVALAAHVVRRELRAYCEFKGYPSNDYFAASA